VARAGTTPRPGGSDTTGTTTATGGPNELVASAAQCLNACITGNAWREQAQKLAVCTENSDPHVLVMQSAEERL
jgi:hypothetical protein